MACHLQVLSVRGLELEGRVLQVEVVGQAAGQRVKGHIGIGSLLGLASADDPADKRPDVLRMKALDLAAARGSISYMSHRSYILTSFRPVIQPAGAMGSREPLRVSR